MSAVRWAKVLRKDRLVSTFDDARAGAEHLLNLEGIVGVGEGMTSDGARSIVVMVTSRSIAPLMDIPSEIEGFPVEVVETGVI